MTAGAGPSGAREKVVAVRRQVGRVLVTVVAVGAVVSGCGGPSQAGAAVIVGSETVSLDRIQTELGAGLMKTELVAEVTAQGGGPADIARDFVTRAVMHDLLARAAAGAGIGIPESAVDSAIEERGGAEKLLPASFTDAAGLREQIRDDLIAAELGRRAVAGLSVTADLFAVPTRQEAENVAGVLAAGGPGADALFDMFPRTSARATTFVAVESPDDASTVLFGTPVGGTVAFQPNPQQNAWFVFRVLDRRTDGVAQPGVLDQISQDQFVAIGRRTVQPAATELGVRVNPRFGVWDPIRLRVVAADQTAGPVLPPARG